MQNSNKEIGVLDLMSGADGELSSRPAHFEHKHMKPWCKAFPGASPTLVGIYLPGLACLSYFGEF